MEKKKKNLTLAILGISFLVVLVFNILTPMVSDDFDYASQARSAASLLDLFKQEYNQYMTWNGRTVTFMLFRIFLCTPDIVLKVANSLMFALLSVLIYFNIERQERWDPFVMLLIHLGLWIFGVAFAQTILWECGAFVYLWGMTIIMLFVTLTRRYLKDGKNHGILAAIGLFFLGVAAGWCNENTSGGALLLLLMILAYRIKKKKKSPLFLYAAVIGNIIGLGLLVLGPGVRNRASFADDNYSGILKYIARFQKLTLYVEEEFFVLIVIFAATIIWSILCMQASGSKMSLKNIIYRLRFRLTFFFLSIATVYALVATSLPQVRALFGAGVFLLIACIQGLRDNLSLDAPFGDKVRGQMLRFVYGTVSFALTMYLVFTWIDCGVDLQRIKRDYDEKVSYIEEQKALGNDDIVIAKYHTDFDNKYTCVYGDMELTDDPSYWTNVQYENYFGVSKITAIDYDEWESLYGNE